MSACGPITPDRCGSTHLQPRGARNVREPNYRLGAGRDLLETHRPGDIIVGGISAGANLAGALTLRARDEGLPMPAAVVMMTPGSDITGAGDTLHTLRGIDPVLKTGFPPTFLQSGTRDLLLSNTVRMHRKLRAAGIAAELHVFEAMPHGGFGGGTPDDLEGTMELRRFLAAHWSPASTSP